MSVGESFSDIEEALLGGPPVFTRDQAITELGVDADFAHELWRAFGFARFVILKLWSTRESVSLNISRCGRPRKVFP